MLSSHNMKILFWCLCTEIAGNDYISLHNSSRKFSECSLKYLVVNINCKIPSDSQFYGSQVTHYSSAKMAAVQLLVQHYKLFFLTISWIDSGQCRCLPCAPSDTFLGNGYRHVSATQHGYFPRLSINALVACC